MHAGYCSPTCLRSQIRKANRKIVRFDELQKLPFPTCLDHNFLNLRCWIRNELFRLRTGIENDPKNV